MPPPLHPLVRHWCEPLHNFSARVTVRVISLVFRLIEKMKHPDFQSLREECLSLLISGLRAPASATSTVTPEKGHTCEPFSSHQHSSQCKTPPESSVPETPVVIHGGQAGCQVRLCSVPVTEAFRHLYGPWPAKTTAMVRLHTKITVEAAGSGLEATLSVSIPANEPRRIGLGHGGFRLISRRHSVNDSGL